MKITSVLKTLIGQKFVQIMFSLILCNYYVIFRQVILRPSRNLPPSNGLSNLPRYLLLKQREVPQRDDAMSHSHENNLARTI